MDEARRRVSDPFWAGFEIFIVRAGHQRKGRGRRGARWIDRPGDAILATIVLRHTERRQRFDTTIPLRVGLGVCRGIEQVLAMRASVPASVPVRPQIKWPNDILVGDRKLAGVLVESDAERSYVGLGINLSPVNAAIEGLPPISLAELVVGTEDSVDAPPVLRVWPRVLASVREAIEDPEWYEAVTERLAWRGGIVEIDGVAGRITGITRVGALCLASSAGTEVEVVAGTLRRRPTA